MHFTTFTTYVHIVKHFTEFFLYLCKWYHTVLSLLWLAFFCQFYVCTSHACKLNNFTYFCFCCWIEFHVYVPWLTVLFADVQVIYILSLLHTWSNGHLCTCLLGHMCRYLWGRMYPGMEFLGWHICNFPRYCQIALQGSFTIYPPLTSNIWEGLFFHISVTTCQSNKFLLTWWMWKCISPCF